MAKPKGLKPGAIKPKAVAAAAKAAKKPTKKPKTELQTLQQADRLMGKLAKRQASIKVDKVGLDEGLRQVRRNNSRAVSVNRALDNRGLLSKYQKLTAPADAIRMTPAGKGIPQPKAAKPAAAAKAAARRKSVGSISEAKAGRIISRIDANRPGLRRASGSARKTANAIRTQQRATDFALAASARGRKQGKNLSVNQSLQRAIKNASAKAKPAAKPAAATKPAALKTKKARTDEGAFGDRYKRAGKVGLKRSIKESDNLNNPTGKATFEKRFAATQQRQSQADRTAAAAKDFYKRFGSPMSFAQRPKLSTAGGARFGIKKKPARKPRGMR